MRTFLAALAVVAALSFAQTAAAEDFYVKAEVGQTFDTQAGPIEFSDGNVFGAYVGTALGPFRVEAGVSHLDANTSFFGIPVEASANDYNATAYLDTASGLYVGAGVDYIQAEASVANVFNIDQSGFGWHASGGYAFRAAGGIVEIQATYLDANLDDVDLSGVRATLGYRHAL